MIDTATVIDHLIRTNEAFTQLTAPEIELVKDNHQNVFYKKGQIIFSENQHPEGLLCLIEGKVKIFQEGAGGREQILRLARPKGFIGYRALFAEESYAASARAIEDSLVCEISKSVIFKLLEKNNRFARKMIFLMAKELGVANQRTMVLTQKHIRGRLAESLLFLKETYGVEDDGRTIRAYLSRQDIAGLSNMTTSNAIRTLSAFVDEGIIEVHGRRIGIKDINKLIRISEMG